MHMYMQWTATVYVSHPFFCPKNRRFHGGFRLSRLWTRSLGTNSWQMNKQSHQPKTSNRKMIKHDPTQTCTAFFVQIISNQKKHHLNMTANAKLQRFAANFRAGWPAGLRFFCSTNCLRPLALRTWLPESSFTMIRPGLFGRPAGCCWFFKFWKTRSFSKNLEEDWEGSWIRRTSALQPFSSGLSQEQTRFYLVIPFLVRVCLSVSLFLCLIVLFLFVCSGFTFRSFLRFVWQLRLRASFLPLLERTESYHLRFLRVTPCKM